MITSFKRVGEIYMYWYMELSLAYMVNCKKQGTGVNGKLLPAAHPDLLSTLLLALGDQPLWNMSLGSSVLWLLEGLASEEPLVGSEERGEAWVLIPPCLGLAAPLLLPPVTSPSLAPLLPPRGTGLSPCGPLYYYHVFDDNFFVKTLSSHFPNLSVPSVSCYDPSMLLC